MKDFFEDNWIAIIVILCILVLFAFYCYADYKWQQEYYYKYIDLDNNEGYAENCSFTDKSGFSGCMVVNKNDDTI